MVIEGNEKKQHSLLVHSENLCYFFNKRCNDYVKNRGMHLQTFSHVNKLLCIATVLLAKNDNDFMICLQNY